VKREREDALAITLHEHLERLLIATLRCGDECVRSSRFALCARQRPVLFG
jgi:hypothetical protein